MNIDAMEGYLGKLRIMRPMEYANIMKLQGKISALTEKIQELTLPKIG